MRKPLNIIDWASFSVLGNSKEAVWNSYLNSAHYLSHSKGIWQAKIGKLLNEEVEQFLEQKKSLQKLDRSTQLGCWVANSLQNLNNIDPNCGVNAGSSRGATHKMESAYQRFFSKQEVPTQTSPQTTAGNIASFIAQTLGSEGIDISHSITCSTFSHGIANANAWLSSEMTSQFAVFGCEAPLTPFTFSQMNALGIYTQSDKKDAFPCKAMDMEKNQNTMCLGEGAFGLLLNQNGKSKFSIAGLGYSKEHVKSAASVSLEGTAIQKAMKMAIGNYDLKDIDGIVTHTPGTILGDQSEVNAIKSVFGKHQPKLTNNKWKIGHTFGASGGFSLEMALLMLAHQTWIYPPYLNQTPTDKTELKNILINAIGFGGNAISLLVSKNEN